MKKHAAIRSQEIGRGAPYHCSDLSGGFIGAKSGEFPDRSSDAFLKRPSGLDAASPDSFFAYGLTLCFVAGLAVSTSMGRSTWERMEHALFQKIPGYALFEA
jgi:hypothetical protein